MTDEQWKQVEKNISGIYFSIHLKIDGYDITLQPVKNGNLKFMIAVYVNGYIKGEWIINDCEIRKKFYRSISKCSFTKKDIEKIVTLLVALMDAYKDEEERELNNFSPIEIVNGDMTENFYCMFCAIKLFYQKMSNTECDDLEFIAILNRLAFQYGKRASDVDEEIQEDT